MKVDALLMELFPEKYSKIKPKAKKTAAKYKQQQLKEQQKEAHQQLQQQQSHQSHHPSSYSHNSHQVIILIKSCSYLATNQVFCGLGVWFRGQASSQRRQR